MSALQRNNGNMPFEMNVRLFCEEKCVFKTDFRRNDRTRIGNGDFEQFIHGRRTIANRQWQLKQ